MVRSANVPTSSTTSYARSDSFVLLGATQADQGQTKYRLGQCIKVNGEVDLHSLSQPNTQIAGGVVSVVNDHGNLHVYGSAHNSNDTFSDFKMVVENRDDGAVYTEVCILDGENGDVVKKIEGFVIEANTPGGKKGIDKLSSTEDNVLTISTRDGVENVNLGKVDLLVVDRGTIDNKGPAFRTERDQDSLSIYLDGPLADHGEYGSTPIATIHGSRLAGRFTQPSTGVQVSAELASGQVTAPSHGASQGFSR